MISVKHDLTVLYAEDEEMIRLPFTEMLERRIERVIAVSSGEEAYEIYRQGGIDMLITDIKMPVMSGHTMAGIIRTMEKYEGRPHTPIYALTQYGDQDTKEKNKILDILPGLDKPVKESDLLKILNNFQYTRRKHEVK